VELRQGPVRDVGQAAARPAAPTRGDARVLMGTWARLTAVAAVLGTGLAVASGAAGGDTAHRLLAGLALPPLAALAATAWVSARRLLPSALAAIVLFGLAALLTGRVVHLAFAALALAATVVLAVQTFRGHPVQGPLRDYVTL